MIKTSYFAVLSFILVSANLAWGAPFGHNWTGSFWSLIKKNSAPFGLCSPHLSRSYSPKSPSSSEFREAVQCLIPGMPVEQLEGWALDNADNRENYTLSDDEVVSLFVYSSDGFRSVNHELREGALSEEVSVFTQVLTNAMKQLPVYKGFVYRGVNLPKQELGRHQVGKEVRYQGFTSTSKKRIYLDRPHQLRIFTCSGRVIRDFSAHRDEEEILIPAGACFEVTDREENALLEYLISQQKVKLGLKELDRQADGTELADDDASEKLQ
jgi:hypothetical protein